MEEINKINLKEQFLKMYVEEATSEQLQYINSLLDSGEYEEIDRIINEYTNSIINNKDLKEFGGNGGSSNPAGGNPINRANEKTSTEEMDPQSFELYSILMLIDEYLNEKDEVKKQLLQNEIQMALERYRTPKVESPSIRR